MRKVSSIAFSSVLLLSLAVLPVAGVVAAQPAQDASAMDKPDAPAGRKADEKTAVKTPSAASEAADSAAMAPAMAPTTAPVAAGQGAFVAADPLRTEPLMPASFDCRRAATPTEMAVCADPVLSDLDARLSRAYSAAVRAVGSEGARSLKSGQNNWLRGRDRRCGADRACLQQHMSERTNYLLALARS